LNARRFGATGIVKRFGPVVALNDVSFACERGEIHALLGENGAGKSTLVKILAGAQSPDAGSLSFDGNAVTFHSPQDAVARSIAVVHQDYHVWPDLTVAENIIGTLRRPPQLGAFVRSRTMRREAHDLLARLGIDIDVDRKVRDLDAAEKKFVEIARALAVDAAFLILSWRCSNACATPITVSFSSPTGSKKSCASPTARRSCATAATPVSSAATR